MEKSLYRPLRLRLRIRIPDSASLTTHCVSSIFHFPDKLPMVPFSFLVLLSSLLAVDGAVRHQETNDVMTEAAALMNFARLAYRYPNVEAVMDEPKLCADYKLLASKSTAKDTVFMVYQSTVDPGSIVVVFRGTDTNSQQNLDTDLQTDRVPCTLGDGRPCGTVHSGFLEAYLSVQQDLLSLVKGASRISVTGHSLGSLLLLLLLWLWLRFDYGSSNG